MDLTVKHDEGGWGESGAGSGVKAAVFLRPRYA